MFATLLLATLTGGVATGDVPPQRVSYDLSDLAPPAGGEHRKLHVVPFQMLEEENGPELSDEAFDGVPDVVAELLGTCVARDALQLDGCSVEVEEGGKLMLTAPPAAQHDAAALVAMLRAGLQREAVVTLELLRVNDAGAVDPANLDADLAAGRLQRVLLRTETLFVGHSAECESETHRRLIIDSEPEIAQESAITQPRLMELATGLHALLRVEDAGGGRFALRCAARVSELRSLPARSEGLQTTLNGAAGLSRQAALSNFERPDVAFTTLAASGRVAAGETLVAAAGSQTAHGPVGWVLRVSLGRAAAAPAPMATADGAHAVALFDVSRAQWPQTYAPKPTPLGLAPDYVYPHDPFDSWDPWLLFPAHEPQGTDALQNRMENVCSEAGEEVWLTRRGNWLLACASPAGLALVGHEIEALEPAAADVVLTLQATVHGEDGKARAEASLRLPLRPQDGGLAYAGSEGLTTVGYDVDVAQGAAVTNPSVVGFVDGLALRASSLPDGRTHLELVLNRVLDWERVALNASGIESYERPVWSVVNLERDLRPGNSARLEGVGDPFSVLGSLAIDIGVSAR